MHYHYLNIMVCCAKHMFVCFFVLLAVLRNLARVWWSPNRLSFVQLHTQHKKQYKKKTFVCTRVYVIFFRIIVPCVRWCSCACSSSSRFWMMWARSNRRFRKSFLHFLATNSACKTITKANNIKNISYVRLENCFIRVFIPVTVVIVVVITVMVVIVIVVVN